MRRTAIRAPATRCTEWYNERHEVVLGVTESLIPPEHSPNAYVKLKDALAAMDAWDFTGTLSPERRKNQSRLPAWFCQLDVQFVKVRCVSKQYVSYLLPAHEIAISVLHSAVTASAVMERRVSVDQVCGSSPIGGAMGAIIVTLLFPCIAGDASRISRG
jgi:hypothetical protein